MTTPFEPNSNTKIYPLNIKQLIDGGQRYLIPMYQRNYAWGPSQIEQLIIDTLDAQQNAKLSQKNRTYYLGTLVVFEKPCNAGSKQIFEVIDGQQRLTTLTLLTIYLKQYFTSIDSDYMSWYEEPNIEFESRPKSSEALTALLKDSIEKTDNIHDDTHNSSIISGYKSIVEIMQNKFNIRSEGNQTYKADLKEFCDYLFNKVQIVRIPVPTETDLNHYFEVMNNRGAQLEKHEIIKARLLAVIENAKSSELSITESNIAQSLIHNVWEACSNMNKYIQYGFNTTLRKKIFSENLTCLVPQNFDDLLSIYAQTNNPDNEERSNDNKSKPSLHDILFDEYYANLANPYETADSRAAAENDYGETYYSLINFSNFLLHVLRIMINEQSSSQQDISLDDKQLLPQFEKYILTEPNFNNGKHFSVLSQVKNFIYCLLKTKFIFDHFIIKRNTQDSKGHWTLEKLTMGKTSYSPYYKNSFEQGNDNLLMLQSAFHVSTPTMNYKHWLNAALNYLYLHYNNNDYETGVDSLSYLRYLESVARNFMLRRYLTDNPDEYHQIIYQTKNINSPLLKLDIDSVGQASIRSQIKRHLRYGNIRNIFVFNYLDYLLWVRDNKPSFTFTSRSSIEHFYPQNPINATSDEQEKMKRVDLHRFGNLCLISHSMNSRVSNHVPVAKKQYFNKEFKTHIDSLKLCKMIETLTINKDEWLEAQIIEHENEMLALYENDLGIKFEDTRQ